MKRLDEWIQRHFRAVYVLLILASAGMYGVFSLNTSVWADEAYTFAMIRHSFKEIWQITAADVHPPLYYFLLKLFAAPFHYDLMASRFSSAVPCILITAVGGYQLRKLFGTRTAVLFMLLYLLYPFTMTYAAEARMYSLAQLCIVLNAIYAYRCWKWNRWKDWAVFALSGTCAAYTHYFALVSAGILYGIVLLLAVLRKRTLLKGWAIASFSTVILFLPWLACFVSQLVYKVNNEYWIEPITVGTIVNYVITVFSSSGMASFPLFFGLAYVIAFAALLASRKKEHICLCLCALAVPLGTVIIGLAASILIRPVFVIRYILPSVPLAVFFFAFVLSQLSDEMLFSALLTVAVMGGISNFVVTAKDALLPDTDRISASLVSQFPECSAYIVISGNVPHPSQELSYYDSETPIYTLDALGPDNPYPNRLPYDDFVPEENLHVILILQENEEAPEALAALYSSEFLGSVHVSGVREDLWYLTRSAPDTVS